MARAWLTRYGLGAVQVETKEATMKRSVVAGLIAAALTLSLASCSSKEEAKDYDYTGGGEGEPLVASPPASNNIEDVSWQGDCGNDQVKLEFKAPFSIGQVSSRLIQEGTGEEIYGEQKVAFSVAYYDANTGELVYSSADSGRDETILLVSEQQSQGDPYYEALVGHKVGSCLIMALPEGGNSAEGESGLPAMLVALTVTKAITTLPKAEGEIVPLDDPDLPVVTLDRYGRPFVEMPSVEPPTKLVVKDLIVGEGAPVELGQDVVVHYAGWIWDNEEEFDSTWGRTQPSIFIFDKGRLIDGWIQGLAGKKVGSQVLLVVPPDLAYGAEGQGDIPADSTLVFVIDILDAAQP